jgi:hypothetical protein
METQCAGKRSYASARMTTKLGGVMMLDLLVVLVANGAPPLWDSAEGNPTHPTHSYLTEYAIKELVKEFPAVATFRKPLVDGANMELHETPYKWKNFYGLSKSDLERLRAHHKGTNPGTDDIKGWWEEAIAASAAGRKEQAHFLAGIMMHMIQDMGVPSHAKNLVHQGKPGQQDNFELLALQKWDPNFKSVNKGDPGFAEPWRYYEFSKAWTLEDAPTYNSIKSFSKLWLTAPASQKRLIRERQAKTAMVSLWTLRSAMRSL